MAADATAQHLAVAPTGDVFVTEPGGRRVWRVDLKGGQHVLHEGMVEPTGFRLTPDHSLLQVPLRRCGGYGRSRCGRAGRSPTGFRFTGWRWKMWWRGV